MIGESSLGRLEQLDPAFADRQHRDADLLVLDDLRVHVFEAESVAPELKASSMPFVAMPRWLIFIDISNQYLFDGGIRIAFLFGDLDA